MIVCWIVIIIGLGLIGLGWFCVVREGLDGVSVLIVCGIIGTIFLTVPLYGRWRNLSYTFEPPTSVLKTNNITIITFVDNGVATFASYNTAEMWTSTNIVIRKTFGRNFFNYPVRGYTTDFMSSPSTD
jgi:hypothetical protein